MAKKNAFYATGGVTAVINASACGVIETVRKHRDRIGKLYAGRDGIIGTHRKIRSIPAGVGTDHLCPAPYARRRWSAPCKLKKFEDNWRNTNA